MVDAVEHFVGLHTKAEVRPADDFTILVPVAGDGTHIALGVSESSVQPHPRVHLDIYADEQAAEIEGLIGLGSTRVDWDLCPEQPDFVVLADSRGDTFCVIDTASA